MAITPGHSGQTLANDAATVLLASDADLPVAPCSGFTVGSSGNVQITTAGGNTVILYGLQSGQFVPVRARRIWMTNTTCTNITAVY